jgi:hypothetical protein
MLDAHVGDNGRDTAAQLNFLRAAGKADNLTLAAAMLSWGASRCASMKNVSDKLESGASAVRVSAQGDLAAACRDFRNHESRIRSGKLRGYHEATTRGVFWQLTNSRLIMA